MNPDTPSTLPVLRFHRCAVTLRTNGGSQSYPQRRHSLRSPWA